MRRIVVGEDRPGHEKDAGSTPAGGQVTLVFPETGSEYEQARADVETLAQTPGRTARRRRRNTVAQASDPIAASEKPVDGCYVVTTDKQRRAWGLPDLAAAAGGDADRAEPGATQGRDAVSVVDPSDAVPFLLGNAPRRTDRRPDRADAGGPRARPGRARPGRPDAPTVNLKQNRGPLPADLRTAFGELCQRPRIERLLQSIDAVIEPLEHSVAPSLRSAGEDVAALRRQVIAPERSGAHAEDDAERTACLCWTVARRLRRACKALGRIDFSGLPDVKSDLSGFRSFLDQTADAPPLDAARHAAVTEKCGQALLGFERAAEQVLDRLGDIADARREVAAGDWNDAALQRVGRVIERLDNAQEVLDDGTLPDERISAVRDELAEIWKERQSAGTLAATFQDVLERIESADLPVPVLARALDEFRLSLASGQSAATVSLDRLGVLVDLPWTARAAERIDVAAAMAALESAYAGRRTIKERIRLYLAVRQLNGTTWTVEGCRTSRSPRNGGVEKAAPQRLVVRPAQPAGGTPILCFAGPPGCGKTALAKLVAEALQRPAVVVALGGVWDEAAIRGLPIAFRAPEPGRIVRGLLDAGVRNPVVVLDEIDKVGGSTTDFGDPSAALLEALDPEQHRAFRDVYLDVPFDLSEVLFIATANDLARIPGPLRDRLEVIETPGYTAGEKLDIVKKHLWRKQVELNGLNTGAFWTNGTTVRHGTETEAADGSPADRGPLSLEVLGVGATVAAGSRSRPSAPPPVAAGGGSSGPVKMTDAAVLAVVRGHTCEAGVRELNRRIGAVCRHVACRRVETGDTAPVTVAADAAEAARLELPRQRCITVEEILGPARNESLPDAVRDAIGREHDRVAGLHPADSEAARAQAWIEVVQDLPWRRQAERPIEAPALRQALDRLHVGRAREKDSTVDHLVAREAESTEGARGPHAAAGVSGPRPDSPAVLCLAGPPGIGKTAFVRALAAAFDRPFAHVSLSGIKDAAALLGVARPAPEAAPGRLVRDLRQLGGSTAGAGGNPLVALRGIDQVAEAAADALLDVIDPARNHLFRDHYVGVPLDLSAVTFVATATDPANIPPLLRERMEVLALSGYTEAEKLRIATGHLLPGKHARYGLTTGHVAFSPNGLRRLIDGYTCEPGVHHLDARIDEICRRVARLLREGLPCPGRMEPETVAAWLGAAPFRKDDAGDRTRRPGVALGLAATIAGGEVVVVEARCLPGSGVLRVTGGAGEALRESAHVARTWVRANAARFAGNATVVDDKTDVHVHLPAGAHSKDGPSAGVTLVAALVSAVTGKPARGDVAMTGEATLAGTLERVGGIREKVLGACRRGLAAVVLPASNEPDVVEGFGDGLPDDLRVHYAATIDDVLRVALPDVMA